MTFTCVALLMAV